MQLSCHLNGTEAVFHAIASLTEKLACG